MWIWRGVRRIDDIGRQRLARVELGGRPLVATVPEGHSVDREDRQDEEPGALVDGLGHAAPPGRPGTRAPSA
jgi:glycerol transport system ATP-binding protein